MWCSIHNIEYGPGLLSVECPSCRSERKQQEERKREQEETLFEQRQQREVLQKQNEILEKTRIQNEEREWERQAAIADLAAAERLRLKEERDFRNAEQLRAMLRAGLAEFPIGFQERWREINENKAAAERTEEEFEQNRTKLRNAIKAKRLELAATRKRGSERFAQKIEALLKTEEGRREMEKLPHGRIGKSPNFLLAAKIYKAVTESSFVRPVSRLLPRDLSGGRATAAQALELIERAVERARPIKKRGGCFYSLIGVALFFLSCVTLGPILYKPSNVIPAFIAVWSITIIGPIVIRILFELHRAHVDSDLGMLLRNTARLTLLLNLTDRAKADSADKDSPPAHETVLQMIRTTRRNFLDILLTDYFENVLPSTPEAPKISMLEKDIQAGEGQLRNLEEEDARSKTAHENAKNRYAVARREILRIGREVFDGVRAQGRGVEIVVCGRCSEYVDASHRICPFCSPAS